MSMQMKSGKPEDMQLYREMYIREIDASKDKTSFVKNNAKSLQALGLTMYSKNYSMESILYNVFAMSELDENISLHPEQQRVLNKIENNKGVIFSAPTSFGKTFIVFEYICRKKPQNVVMVVPTLALIDEYKQKIIKQYKDKFSEYNIYLSIDPNKEYNFSEKNIFIVTHDRVIDENVVSIFEAIDFLVIDEVYKLQKNIEDDRVLILNIAYYNMVSRSKKYVLLAPFIKGVDNLDKLGDTPEFYSTNYSPVVNDVKIYDIMHEKERGLYTDKILNSLPIEDNTLIYFPTVVQIDSFIENTTISYPLLRDENKVLKDFVKWGKREIHPEWSVVKALEKGFLIHHGQLPLGIRMFQLYLFNSEESKYTRLICTSTLLEGVNTNAKNIIITKPNRVYNKNFDAFDFYNLVGRTGRLYQHYLGVAHYIKMPADPIYEKSEALKSIEFELTDDSVDMDINFGNYEHHGEFIAILERLGITYDDYKQEVAKKYRFSTVQFVLHNYELEKDNLIKELCRQRDNTAISKLELIRSIVKIIDPKMKDPKLKTFIINKLTYKYRQNVREVVDETVKYYSKRKISSIINATIKFKTSYIEFDFYSKTDLLRFIMRCDGVDEELIDIITNKIMKNIEALYYMNSPSKKLLKDMGIYDGDIDNIVKIIGNDFSSVAELQKLIIEHKPELNRVSIISKYVIARLVN